MNTVGHFNIYAGVTLIFRFFGKYGEALKMGKKNSQKFERIYLEIFFFLFFFLFLILSLAVRWENNEKFGKIGAIGRVI